MKMKNIKPDKLSKIIRLVNLIEPFIKSVISLLRLGNVVVRYDPDSFKKFSRYLLKELSNKGARETVKLYKEYHRVGTCVVLEIDFEPVPRRRMIKGTKIPRDLRPLLVLLTGTVFEKRIGMTILNLYKLLRLAPSDDLSTITEGGAPVTTELIDSFTTFLKRCPNFMVRSTKPNQDSQREFLGYITSANGPNGPMLRTSHRDAIALYHDKPLLESVLSLLEITGGSIHKDLISMIAAIEKMKDKPLPHSIHSKVSQLSEGGGKTRNIAIIDYYSQTSLKWIHDVLMSRLKDIRCDATYSQEDGFALVRSKAKVSEYCASLDLSSATDTFPIVLQILVINKIFGDKVGKLWSEVISLRRKFHLKDRIFSWGRGQPLGALSSWASFALTHHLFIRWCANDPYYSNYVILGDDVAIMDEQVATVYRDRMAKCGVQVNMSKGFISKGTKIYGEFAKRIFLNEDELSGIPIDLIVSCRKTLYMIPDFLNFITRRWNIVLPGSELYAPECFSFLSQKGKRLLSIVLVFRSTIEAKINLGFPWCALNSEDTLLTTMTVHYFRAFEERISTFMDEGSMLRSKFITENIIKPISKNEGNHVSDMVLAHLQTSSHPMALLALKMGMLLTKAEANINASYENLDNFITEFLPDVHLRSYFYDRKTVRNVTLGKTALKIYYDSIKELNVTKPLQN